MMVNGSNNNEREPRIGFRLIGSTAAILGLLAWCGFILTLCLLGSFEEETCFYVPASPFLAGAAAVSVVILVAFIKTKHRLAIFSALSLLFASVACGLGIGTRTVYVGAGLFGDSKAVFNNVTYIEVGGVRCSISRGGVFLRYTITSQVLSPPEPGMIRPGQDFHEHIYFDWGLSKRQPYPHVPDGAGRGPAWLPISNGSWAGFGFCWYLSPDPPQPKGLNQQAICGVVFPIWVPIPICLIAPLLYLRKALILRSRRKQGLCLTCGYDMRATPAKCPECGRTPGRPERPPPVTNR